jgi:hypothetical protein
VCNSAYPSPMSRGCQAAESCYNPPLEFGHLVIWLSGHCPVAALPD